MEQRSRPVMVVCALGLAAVTGCSGGSSDTPTSIAGAYPATCSRPYVYSYIGPRGEGDSWGPILSSFVYSREPIIIENASSEPTVISAVAPFAPAPGINANPCTSLAVGSLGPGQRKRVIVDEPNPSVCRICAGVVVGPHGDAQQCLNLWVTFGSDINWCD
jgi:hypothetical protein